MKKENMIWSNDYDWVVSIVQDLIESREYEDLTEDQLYEVAYDTLGMYHGDIVTEARGLAPYGIIGIADLGFWNGRKLGYHELDDLEDVFYGEYDIMRFGFVRNDLHAELVHHDGTHFVKYRAWKKDTTFEQKEDLLEDIYNGDIAPWKVTRYTEALKPIMINGGVPC